VKIVSETREEVDTYASSGEAVIGQLVTVMMNMEDNLLQVYLNPVEQSITLHTKTPASLLQLGKKFDDEMAKGKYQEYFARYE
jgi:hypothetical protein